MKHSTALSALAFRRLSLPLLLSATLSLFIFSPPFPRAFGENIRVGSKEYLNAEMVDLLEEGVLFTSAQGELVLPWRDLSTYQKNQVKSEFSEALRNLRLKAVWIEGEVLEKIPEGVVVTLFMTDDETGDGDSQENGASAGASTGFTREFKNGAKVLNALAIIEDHPNESDLGEGAKIAVAAFQKDTFTYKGILGLPKEVPVCTLQWPEWAHVRIWTNTEGKKIQARLAGVDGENCIFEMSGKQVAYPIKNLSEEDRKVIETFAANTRPILLD